MIDLNYKAKSAKEEEEEDVPDGVIILILLPFVFLFWTLIELGL